MWASDHFFPLCRVATESLSHYASFNCPIVREVCILGQCGEVVLSTWWGAIAAGSHWRLGWVGWCCIGDFVLLQCVVYGASWKQAVF